MTRPCPRAWPAGDGRPPAAHRGDERRTRTGDTRHLPGGHRRRQRHLRDRRAILAQFSGARLADHRFVAIDDAATVLGWVAGSPTSSRPVYAGVVEHSVYVHPDARGLGVGRQLLDALIASTEDAGIWTLQSGVFPENTGSLRLHASAGFRVVGIRERLGRQHGRWRDVVTIERRSPRI